MDLIADTNLIVAIEREARRKINGPAHRFLEAHASDRFYITFTVSGELACGDSASVEADWRTLCDPYGLIEWSSPVSLAYGRVYRTLKARGTLIGTNDLWIAATALVHGMPVVTGTRSEFERVPGLSVLRF